MILPLNFSSKYIVGLLVAVFNAQETITRTASNIGLFMIIGLLNAAKKNAQSIALPEIS